ncbi:hypothetical protein RJ639_003999 [Escallonia herrerae]|uniref:Uncharacterized protein n=1 Tax=Escallonia herrerae TaxID=1293975 RepID=A0AA88VZ29_9ASTE|nr:hypothetical protein RJ639_003999 [Escallonia herrerae]
MEEAAKVFPVTKLQGGSLGCNYRGPLTGTFTLLGGDNHQWDEADWRSDSVKLLKSDSAHPTCPGGQCPCRQHTRIKFWSVTLTKDRSPSGNQLTGQIPPSLGSLKNLLKLTLTRNSFYLDLSYNVLSGLIPQFAGHLHNLTFLDLSNNQLSRQIPGSLCNVATLSDMSLSHKHLIGRIPFQIGHL